MPESRLDLARIVVTACALMLAELSGSGCADTQERPSVAIVVLDAARADHFGAYGYARPTTPNFDALAAESVVFDQAIANASFTVASVASLLSGLPTARHGVTEPGHVIDPSITTLAEILSQEGYRTAAFTENPLLDAEHGYAQGFDLYRVLTERWKPGDGREIDLSRSAEHVAEMVAWIDAAPASAPFFLYAHLLRPHNPYHALPQQRGRFSHEGSSPLRGGSQELADRASRAARLAPGDLQHLIDLYDENLLSADALLGSILAALRERHRLDSTLVFVTSDHGEAFGEHGRLLHGFDVFQEGLRIPLLMKLPASLEIGPRRIHATVQLSDILPTSLSVLGLKDRPNQRPRRDLLSLARAESATAPVVVSHAVGSDALHEGRLKLIESYRGRLLFDLSEDPGEKRDLSERRAGEAEAMSQRLSITLTAQREGLGREPERDVDAEFAERLRALGYVLEEERER